jgi:hypothetical protein
MGLAALAGRQGESECFVIEGFHQHNQQITKRHPYFCVAKSSPVVATLWNSYPPPSRMRSVL